MSLYNEIVVAASAAVDSGDSDPEGFDRFNAGNPLDDAVAALVVATVTGTVTASLLESDTTDTASAMDAVDASEAQNQPLVLTTSNDNATHYLGYLGNKRYVGVALDGDYSVEVVWCVTGPRTNVR